MTRNGRSRAASAVTLTRFACFYSFIALSAEIGFPVEIKLWSSHRSPLSRMVDATNEFGIKMLAEHNYFNNNNIAFSPYGLMGILVALYEGVDGTSSYQIERSLKLPRDRNVTRIGFRDIHRTLKTYFAPEEGFLAGLALSNENVTFNEAYVNILRFYGFDLESEHTTQKPTDRSTSTSSPETKTPANSVNTIPNKDGVTSPTQSTREDTTPNSNVDNVDMRSPKEETITNTVTSHTTIISAIETITTSPLDAVKVMKTETASTAQLSEQITTQTSTLEPQSLIKTSTASLANESSSVDLKITNISTTDVSQTTIIDTTTTTTSSTDSKTEATILDNMSTTVSEGDTTTDASVQSTTTASTPDTTQILKRRKRSIEVFLHPSYLEENEAFRTFHIPPSGSSNPVTAIDYNKMFLVNGVRNIEVIYMHYDTILDHAFLPHLEASALRLPLDTDNYYLLIVLPYRRSVDELNSLLARMAMESDLSDVYSALRPCRVQATVPSFVVKGHVTLTIDLQKLGILNVFEPRQYDFTPMTSQAGVYVRSIEQAVSVKIRKFRETSSPKAINPNLVYFSATYPFLYFVMDANIHVALMAGKMVDPRNARIL